MDFGTSATMDDLQQWRLEGQCVHDDGRLSMAELAEKIRYDLVCVLGDYGYPATTSVQTLVTGDNMITVFIDGAIPRKGFKIPTPPDVAILALELSGNHNTIDGDGTALFHQRIIVTDVDRKPAVVLVGAAIGQPEAVGDVVRHGEQ